MLAGKHILLGVTGSIAAYKAAFLIRLLVKAGAEVQVMMTDAARTFIQPLTLSTLSKNPVISTYADDLSSGVWNNHVEWAQWADLQLIAPASANTLAKMASGTCDNVLMATYLSAKSPVWAAPAMDLDMYQHPTTKANLERLQEMGIHIVPAERGELASGLEGEGRMAEPEHIVAALERFFEQGQDFTGKTFLITAGPTYEAIDPVRFIGNHSSGKMGIELAQAAAERGAKVQLITGPTSLQTHHPSITRTSVTSAQDMLKACVDQVDQADVVIMSAAVADYAPAEVANEKIKKAGEELTIRLRKTPDILSELSKQKKPGQLFLGFALETENELAHAQEKRIRKGLDFIALNSLSHKGAGFGHDTNRITWIGPDNKAEAFELKSKAAVAHDILDKIREHGA